VLEVCGEHRLASAAILVLLASAALLLSGYALHAAHAPEPLLRVGPFAPRCRGAFF
jgi:hypothetical protein